MSTAVIPKSVGDYLKNKKIRLAVDSLLPILGGSEMPAVESIEDARSLNTAIFMAAQVRHDYIEMIFQLWQTIFGELCANHGLTAEFEPGHFTLNHIWREGEVACIISRDHHAKIKYELWHCISPQDDGDIILYLQANQLNSDNESLPLRLDEINLDGNHSWEETVFDDDTGGVCITANDTYLKDFISDPEGYVDRSRTAAKELIDAISRATRV